jgi:hypothetical protein
MNFLKEGKFNKDLFGAVLLVLDDKGASASLPTPIDAPCLRCDVRWTGIDEILNAMGSHRNMDTAKDALEEARQFAAQGKFEEALQRHIWFHDHALEIRQSYYGVRLSYALLDWVELGKLYPKAMEVLRTISDQKTSRLLAGELSRALFHDVESINENLNESAATAQLFSAISASHPGFAASIYDLAEEALIKAEEYELARKYLGDPMLLLKRAKMEFDWGMEYANTMEDAKSKEAREAFDRIFEGDAARIITVVTKTGEQSVARDIQSEALTVLAYWLSEWRFIEAGHPVRTAGMVTLRPAGGLPLRLERR